MAESRGINVLRSNDGSILILRSLVDPLRRKITTGTAAYRLWHVVPETGALEAYDFAAGAFRAAGVAVTTPTAALTYRSVESPAYDTGLWTARFTGLSALVAGDKYLTEVTHASLGSPALDLIQYGGVEGEAASELQWTAARAGKVDYLDLLLSTIPSLVVSALQAAGTQVSAGLTGASPGQALVTMALWRGAVERWLQDDAQRIDHAAGGDLDSAILMAVTRYSGTRPRVVSAVASGTGTAYDFSLPSGWVDGFSRLVRVEHPFGATNGSRAPHVVFDAADPNAPAEVEIVRVDATVEKIRFLTLTPASGTGNVLLLYTVPHAVTATASTVPVYDEQAVAVLAAAYACEMVASKYAETKDAAIAADAVDYRSRSREYADRAERLLKIYDSHVGAAHAPGAVVEWDAALLSGRDRLLYPARLV